MITLPVQEIKVEMFSFPNTMQSDCDIKTLCKFSMIEGCEFTAIKMVFQGSAT